jgi:hypothetical protein
MMEAVPDRRPEMSDRHGTVDKENFGGATREEDEGVGCKGAVEIVSRNSQKGAFQNEWHGPSSGTDECG